VPASAQDAYINLAPVAETADMYTFLSELLRPPSLFFLVVFLALAYQWLRRPEERRRLLVLIVPVVVFLLCFIPAVSYLVMGSLEWAYPPLEQRPADIDAIVVLSGYIRPLNSAGTQYEPGEDTLYRCLRAAEVYRQGKPCPMLLSGGKVDPDTPGPTLAEGMRDVLVQMGIPARDLILEARSRTTYENAVESSRILQERHLTRVLLVTDGAHMRRSVACFQKQGVTVTPCGCRYRAAYLRGDVWDYFPQAGIPEDIDDAWHEWLGLAWYKATGKI
jgi:uncharacterized SAM-binding protein YcdF (DUF218 family)